MMTKEEFIEKATVIHGNKFDYSSVTDTAKRSDKVKIICPIHGDFFQSYSRHVICKYGCNKCKYKIIASIRSDGKEKFIEKAISVHNDAYDYSDVIYVNARTKVKIKCNKCKKIIIMTPDNHIRGECECFNCFKSKGEKKVQKILDKYNLQYDTQKTFETCKDIGYLKFDFYLTELNICIEYDGELHYKESRRGNRKPPSYYVSHDNIKTKYCLDNGIKLIRIKYTDFKHIESILSKELSLNQESVSMLTHSDSVQGDIS